MIVKKQISGLAVGLLLVVVFITGVVAAQGNSDNANPPERSETAVASEQSDNDEVDTEETRESRVERYKARKTEALTEARERRLQTRCKAAQNKVTALSQGIASSADGRSQRYQNLAEKIAKLISRLQLADVDTTALETAYTDLQNEVASLKEFVSDYVVTLEDLAALDCEADPEAFQAALEAARELKQAANAQYRSVRAFISNDLKLVLDEIKSQLSQENEDAVDSKEPSETASENEEGEN